MPESALDRETTGDGTASFSFLGRDWTVPTRRHLSHLRRMRDELKSGYGSLDLLVVETFLGDEQLAALLDIDPDETQLAEMARLISEAMGLGDGGNSQPSSASS